MGRSIDAPMVYVGATIGAELIRQTLPDAILRESVKRGDLYRDRLLGGHIFLIIDGVFHQDEAISPREVIDVARSGATVFGAASMGALRAAECWPVGVLGVGSIYRLFRRGLLDSDDEVAVTFAPVDSRSVSVALINVRYATWRAAKHGRMDRREAQRLVDAACSLFYWERHWPSIFRSAGISPDPALMFWLAEQDLKVQDASRGLRKVARWRSERGPARPLQPTDYAGWDVFSQQREGAREPVPQSYDASTKTRVLCWAYATGRYRRYLASPLKAGPLPELLGFASGSGVPPRSVEDDSLRSDAVWAAMTAAHAIGTESLRMLTVHWAAERARHLGLSVEDSVRLVVEQRMATEHGANDWATLVALAKDQKGRDLLRTTRDQLALARTMRAALPIIDSNSCHLKDISK